MVAGDLVDAVYRIDGWERVAGGRRRGCAGPSNGSPSPVRRDPELEGRYVGRSVGAYLGAGTPSPVTYVWCGPHWVNTAQLTGAPLPGPDRRIEPLRWFR